MMANPTKSEQSLYARYVLEREKMYTIEREYGFAMYKFMPGYVYLVDIYVVPEARRSDLGTELESAVIAEAHAHDFNILVGSVDEQAETADYMKEVMRRRGYKEMSRDGHLIYYQKGI